MRKGSLLAFLLLVHCGQPGVRVDPAEGDYAFLEIQLRG
jgi:hypothetical protein